MGCRTLLLTHKLETLGADELQPGDRRYRQGPPGARDRCARWRDGAGGRRAAIQFRTLNASKGPAVRATRAQADRQLYKRAIRAPLENQPGLSLFQQEAADL